MILLFAFDEIFHEASQGSSKPPETISSFVRNLHVSNTPERDLKEIESLDKVQDVWSK